MCCVIGGGWAGQDGGWPRWMVTIELIKDEILHKTQSIRSSPRSSLYENIKKEKKRKKKKIESSKCRIENEIVVAGENPGGRASIYISYTRHTRTTRPLYDARQIMQSTKAYLPMHSSPSKRPSGWSRPPLSPTSSGSPRPDPSPPGSLFRARFRR